MTSDNGIQVLRDETRSVTAEDSSGRSIDEQPKDLIVMGAGLRPHYMNWEVIQAHAKEHGLENIEQFVVDNGMEITDEEVLARIRMNQSERGMMGDSTTTKIHEYELQKVQEPIPYIPREKTYDHKRKYGRK